MSAITQEEINLAGGLNGGEAIRAFAVGKTLQEFAGAIHRRMEVGIAEAELASNHVAEYEVNGERIKRDLDRAKEISKHFHQLSQRGKGSLIRQSAEFCDWW